MASEVAAIENDWHALGWAAGGLRVLFYSQPKPLATVQDLNAAAQSYAERRRLQVNNVWLARNLFPVILLLYAVERLPKLFHGSDRTASVLLVSGFLIMAVLSYLIAREPNVPDRDDAAGLIRFYREELGRSSNVLSPVFWMSPAFLLVTVGFELTAHSWERIPGLIWLLFFPLFFSRRRSDRHRLAQIDALLDPEDH
jgi:hypothetical protein